MSNNLKTQICDALAVWIRQRPGLETANYFSPYDRGEQLARGISAYRGDARSIARDKRDAETLLTAVRYNDSITAEMLLDAAKHSYSGRLVIAQYRDKGVPVTIEYWTGQYWPTEYRKAAAAVLAGALWAATRDNMPEGSRQGATEGALLYRNPTGAGHVSAGDWMRKHFRNEFGSKMQKRWFD